MENKIKSGDMVSWDFEPKIPAYGTVVWIEGDSAHVDFKNPITYEYQVTKIDLSVLTKVGNSIRKT